MNSLFDAAVSHYRAEDYALAPTAHAERFRAFSTRSPRNMAYLVICCEEAPAIERLLEILLKWQAQHPTNQPVVIMWRDTLTTTQRAELHGILRAHRIELLTFESEVVNV